MNADGVGLDLVVEDFFLGSGSNMVVDLGHSSNVITATSQQVHHPQNPVHGHAATVASSLHGTVSCTGASHMHSSSSSHGHSSASLATFNLHGHPSLAPLHGNGLNLSTNHGLDLTCPHYEGLNLSLTNATNVFSQQQQVARPKQPQLQGLNLSNSSTNGHQFSKTNGNRSNAEVGLNLSIQNAGMNLSRQSSTLQDSQEPGSGPATFHQQHYYYTTHTSGGYINLSTQKVPYGNSNQTARRAYENQRHSPLNLEHRSSPLNLTSGVPHSKVQGQNSEGRQQQLFGIQQQPSNYSSSENYAFQQNNQSNGKSHNYLFELYQQQNMCQNESNGNYCNNIASSSTGYQLETGSSTQNQELISNNNFEYSCQNSINSSATGRVRLFCASCCQEFSSTVDLNKHMERHNSNLLCNAEVLSSQAAIAGKDTSQNVWDASFSNTCNTTVLSQTNFNSEEVCDSTYAFEATTSDPNVSCVPVDYEKSTQKDSGATLPAVMSNFVNLGTNNSSKKLDDPEENCLQCSMTFASGIDLKKHIDLAHNGRQGTLMLQCRICGEEFENKASHKSHMDAHAKDKPFQCEVCGARLANQTGLNRHIKRVHEKQQPFHCEECGKRFYEKHDLQRHIRAHEKATMVPKCPVCDKCFSNTYQKEKHKCKGPEGKYPCELCDSKLESKASWGFHMWRHTKDSKYIDLSPVIPALPSGQSSEAFMEACSSLHKSSSSKGDELALLVKAGGNVSSSSVIVK